MNRTFVLVCCLLALAAAPLVAEQAAPAAGQPAAIIAAGDCAAPQLDLGAAREVPVCAAPAAPADPPASVLPLTHFVCCTQADRQACTAECAPCQGFTHCAAAECLCDCFCG